MNGSATGDVPVVGVGEDEDPPVIVAAPTILIADAERLEPPIILNAVEELEFTAMAQPLRVTLAPLASENAGDAVGEST